MPGPIQRGFTLIELLVSVLIFAMVVLAVYSLFDQGSWFYLHSNRRANVQQTARLALEQLERDIRMSGFGVPNGDEFGGTVQWNPDLILAAPGKVYFRADIDNGHTWVKQDVVAGDTTLHVESPNFVCPVPGTTQIVLSNDLKRWQPLLCTNADTVAKTIDVNPGAMACPSETCEVFTPEHIFYRLTGDTNDDGICDNSGPGAEPFCSIERAVVYGNDPTANSAVPADSQFHELAKNIVAFEVQTTGLLKITLTVRDRSMEGVRKYQDVVLSTEILIRDNVY